MIEKFTEMLTLANRQGREYEIWEKFNIDNQRNAACEYRIARILVIGYSQVNITDLKRVVRNFVLDEDGFKFILEESKIKNDSMESIKNNFKYSDVLWGQCHIKLHEWVIVVILQIYKIIHQNIKN